MEEKLIKIGINARIFPSNWRPLLEEINFCKANGFQSIQISIRDREIDQKLLGAKLEIVASKLAEANIVLTIELLIGIGADGYTVEGKLPLEILETNIGAINALQCKYVHWHLVPLGTEYPLPTERAVIHKLEKLLIPQFTGGVALAQKYNIKFGFEHNEPEWLLFGTPESCHTVMTAVPGLNFVWDINHTIPTHLSGFQDLVPHASIIHVADTPLPEVNYHLPLGQGTVNFEYIAKIVWEKGFSGPAIFEIGGLKKSGGYGRDTDEALIASYRYFKQEILKANSALSR